MAIAVNNFNYKSMREELPFVDATKSVGKALISELSSVIFFMGGVNHLTGSVSESSRNITRISNLNMGYINYGRLKGYSNACSALTTATEAAIGYDRIDPKIAEYVDDVHLEKNASIVNTARAVLWLGNLTLTLLGSTVLVAFATVASPILGLGVAIVALYTVYKDKKKNAELIEQLEGRDTIQNKMKLLAVFDDPLADEKNRNLLERLNRSNYSDKDKARLYKRLKVKNRNEAVMAHYLSKRLTARGKFLVRQNQKLINDIASGKIKDKASMCKAFVFLKEISKEAKVQSSLLTAKALTVTLFGFVAFVTSVGLLFCTPVGIVAALPTIAFLVSTLGNIVFIAHNEYNQHLYGKMGAREVANIISARAQTDVAAMNLLK